MATIVTRAAKGSPLTFSEMDSNFSNLDLYIGGIYYTTSSARTINNSTPKIIFETLVFDDGGVSPWFNSATGVFTAPSNGLYLISSGIQTLSVNISATQSFSTVFTVNNSIVGQFGQVVGTGNASSFYNISSGIPRRLNQGDLVDVRAFCTTSTTSSFVGYQNFISIVRLGS